MDVWGYVEEVFGVCEGDRVFVGSLVAFDEHHEFAEDLAEVAPVYFVDDEYVLLTRVCLGFFAEIVEDAVLEGEVFVFRWTVALDEVFIGVRLVKLDHLYSGV